MKQRSVIGILVFVLSHVISATPLVYGRGISDWEIRPIGSSNSDLFAIDMVNDSVGVAVGEYGLVRTARSSTTLHGLPSIVWSTIPTVARQSLRDVYVLPTRHFIAVGDAGTILRGHIDSTTSRLISSPTQSDLTVVVRDNDRLLIGGKGGVVLSSDDLGTTWNVAQSPTSNDIIDIARFDSIYVLTSTEIWKSATGVEWHIVSLPANLTRPVGLLTFVRQTSPPEGRLIVYGDPWVFVSSSDGGTTWNDLGIGSMAQQFPRATMWSADVSSDGMRMSVTLDERYMPRQFHMISINGGLDWTNNCDQWHTRYEHYDQEWVSEQRLIGVSMDNISSTYTQREDGVMISPENGTPTFTVQSVTRSDDSVYIAGGGGDVRIVAVDTSHIHGERTVATFFPASQPSIVFANSTMIMSRNTNASPPFAPVLERSTDGGQTWQVIPIEDPAMSSLRLYTYASTVLAVGYGKGAMVSTDEGATWTKVMITEEHIYSQPQALLLHESSWIEAVYDDQSKDVRWRRTTDLGSTWTWCGQSPTFGRMVRSGTGRLIMIGSTQQSGRPVEDVVAISDDLGDTWRTTLSGTSPSSGSFIFDAVARDTKIIAAGGFGKYIVSTDNGETWSGDETLASMSATMTFQCVYIDQRGRSVLYTNYGDVILERPSGTTSIHEQHVDDNGVSFYRHGNTVYITSETEPQVSICDVQGRCATIPVAHVGGTAWHADLRSYGRSTIFISVQSRR